MRNSSTRQGKAFPIEEKPSQANPMSPEGFSEEKGLQEEQLERFIGNFLLARVFSQEKDEDHFRRRMRSRLEHDLPMILQKMRIEISCFDSMMNRKNK